MQLYQGDCLEVMRTLPDNSIDLVLTDPPYNIGVTTQKNGRTETNNWDRIDGYIDWSMAWLTECQRILKDNGVLYFWHNDISQIADLLSAIKEGTSFQLVSFCIWDKGDSYRAKTGSIGIRNQRLPSAAGSISASTACTFSMPRRMQTKPGSRRDLRESTATRNVIVR